jgi:tryptophan 2,3-dioxygenase
VGTSKWSSDVAREEARRLSLTYSRYLKLDQLLSAQQPLSAGPEHDEMLFIVVHQVYELWFKQILYELSHLQACLAGDDLPGALHTLKRMLAIFKTMVAQIDILETMTPLSFLSFRSRLEAASGFQSPQFREVEFALGLRAPQMLAHHPEGSEARRRLEATLTKPSLWDSVAGCLAAHGYPVPPEVLGRDLSQPPQENAEMQGILIEVYRRNPIFSMLCEHLVDLDEGLQEWRYRHVKMVERTIGTKPGTGGSLGAAYLRRTLFQPLFPDLWAIRASL